MIHFRFLAQAFVLTRCALLQVSLAIVAILCFFAAVPLVLRTVISIILWVNGDLGDDDGATNSKWQR